MESLSPEIRGHLTAAERISVVAVEVPHKLGAILREGVVDQLPLDDIFVRYLNTDDELPLVRAKPGVYNAPVLMS